MRRFLLPENYFELSRRDRNELLQVAADQLNRPVEALEKDLWVVETLRLMFESSFGPELTFKGGTSLSKGYKVIERFSEDIDITVDIRRILPVPTGQSEYPPNPSQARKWKDRIRKKKLPEFIVYEILPVLATGLPGDVKLSHVGAEVFVDYSKTLPSRPITPDYIKPIVRIEPGGFSTGEPNHHAEIRCDLEGADVGSMIELPKAQVRIMNIERTFWEKATLIHVACVKERKSWEGYTRHWYDLVQIYESKHGAQCVSNQEAARSVVEFKSWFYREKLVDYTDAVIGKIRIVPTGETLRAMRSDYEGMHRMFEREPYPFETLIHKCRELEHMLNETTKGWK